MPCLTDSLRRQLTFRDTLEGKQPIELYVPLLCYAILNNLFREALNPKHHVDVP